MHVQISYLHLGYSLKIQNHVKRQMNGVLAQLEKKSKKLKFTPWDVHENPKFSARTNFQRCRPADSHSKHPNEGFKTRGRLLIFQFRCCEILPILLQHYK